MKIEKTSLPGVLLIQPDVFKDERGFFLESYHEKRYQNAVIPYRFVQDNHSRSVKNAVRGLHAQSKYPQAKLVRVLHGEIFDVAVDIRVGSPTFAHWMGVILNSQDFKQIIIPPGFAHGLCVLSEVAEVEYKCSDFYHPEDEFSILWDDPAIGIKWPVQNPILSKKDQGARPLSQIQDLLPPYAPQAPSVLK